MDPLDFLEHEQLLQFFHRSKTEMSCMDKPHTFLNQLRDYDLISEDRYKKMIRMKSKDNMKNSIYELLDWLERERAEDIQDFWDCVFKENILNQYPTLRLLRNSLMDGSFQFNQKLLKGGEKEKKEEDKKKEPSEDKEGEDKQGKIGKKKTRKRTRSICDEEEQPGPSSQLTPGQRKKPRKLSYYSPLKKGEKKDIWTWGIYKTQLPVTCGDQKGMLNKDRLAKGEKCITVDNQWCTSSNPEGVNQWFTPSGFEEFAGKKSSNNWKLSIKCMGTPLQKLIKDGHLKSPSFLKRSTKAKKLFPSKELGGLITVAEDEDEDDVFDQENEDQPSTSKKGSSTDITDEEAEEEEETEQEPGGSDDSGSDGSGSDDKTVFKVTCGAVAGTLHKDRFSSGTCGKSIRTEKSWMSPVEFMKEGSTQTGASWKKDIKVEDKPISVLLEAKVLNMHSVLCKCRLCSSNPKDLEGQKNDDECFICRSNEEENLVVCDRCPRSFHQKCHLPHVEDDMLGDDRTWVCTFCVFATSQAWRYSDQRTHETALSLHISKHLLECQYLLLLLCNADEDQIFATNPSYVKGYTAMIKSPMWLEKVTEKLLKKHYETVGQFVSDVQLIFNNCATFNRDNAEFQAMGVRLRELFEREFTNVFSIRQETVDG